MRSSLFMKAGVALIAAVCLATGTVALLTSPSHWWLNPDFGHLAAQLQACESPLALHQPCETAKVMTRQALEALRACVGEQADVAGCDVVRRAAARQADSLQQLVHRASVEPTARLRLILGVAFNPWLRAVRSGDGLTGSVWPWLCSGLLLVCSAIGARVTILRIEWRSLESQTWALRSSLDELLQRERQLERLVSWFNHLQSRLRGLLRSRYANLLPWTENGASRGHGEAPDVRARLDQAFGSSPPTLQGGPLGKAMGDDAAWRDLGTASRHGASSGARRLLHLPTGLVLRVTCHRTDDQDGAFGLWVFAVQLDGVEAELPQRRPAELNADFLQSDWLARVAHDKIAANDWPAALAAAKAWLEAVLLGEVGVEDGTLSMPVERRLRDQLLAVQREKSRIGAALRALRADMGGGWGHWCWQRLLRRKPRVSDVAFHVHEHGN